MSTRMGLVVAALAGGMAFTAVSYGFGRATAPVAAPATPHPLVGTWQCRDGQSTWVFEPTGDLVMVAAGFAPTQNTYRVLGNRIVRCGPEVGERTYTYRVAGRMLLVDTHPEREDAWDVLTFDRQD